MGKGEPADTLAELGIVDINYASQQDLIFLPGVGPDLAQRIIAAHPFA